MFRPKAKGQVMFLLSQKKNHNVILSAIAAVGFLLLVALMASSARAEVSRTTGSREAAFNVFVSDVNKTESVNETTYVAFFSVSMENTGDSLGDVVMYLSGFPSSDWDWQPNPGGEDHKIESVWPQEVKWVSIVIYAPLTEKAGNYNLYFEVKPGGPTAEISLKCIIPQKGGIELIPPPNVAREPGIVVEMPFQIHNTGNGDDTYLITSVERSIPDWDVSVVGGMSTVKVKPGATTTKIVKVTVPYEAEATAGTKPGVRIALTVQSNFDKHKVDARGSYIKVLQFWRIIFNVDQVNVTTKPGDRVEFKLSVRNDGNGQDNITLSVEGNVPGWSIGLTQYWFNLSKDTGRVATLTIIPSMRALKGDYWLTLRANSTGPPESPDQETRTVLVTIDEVFDISTTIAANTSAPMPPGGVAEYAFNVVNNGNTNDYVKLTVTGGRDGWFLNLDNEGIPLGPAQKKEVTLTVLASPRLEESPAQKYFFSVKGVSDGRPDLIKYINVSCEISAIGKIDMEVDGDDTITVNPYEKENYNFIFNAMNKGNALDEIHLAISSTSWDQQAVHINPVFYPNILNVPRQETKQTRMEINVPRGTPLGYYDITVVAVSTLNPSSSVTSVVHVKVIQQDVTVQSMRFRKSSETTFKQWKEYKVEEGDTIYIGVPVMNSGSEIVHDVNLKLFQDGLVIKEENISSMGLLKTVVIPVSWKASFLGTFKLKAVASILGDANPPDNVVEAQVKVIEKAGGTGPSAQNPLSFRVGSPLFFLLVIVVVIGILATVRYMLNLRGEQSTRDLYESIYGEDLVQEHEAKKAGDEYKKYDKGNP